MKPIALLFLVLVAAARAEVLTFDLWPGSPPLAVADAKPEAELPLDKGMHPDIVRLGNVSKPQMTVHLPPKEKRNGTAVLILPGGGYSILAMKHEGTQVADFLNSEGVVAAVVKYRVPSPKGLSAERLPLLDAQRAMQMFREHAPEWSVDPARIGVLGFSAGGNLAAWMIAEGSRLAEGGEGKTSPRPDFGVLVYAAYLADVPAGKTAPKLREDEPPGPVLLVHAADDPIPAENSIAFFRELRRLKVSAELHVFSTGGHGYGMLPNGKPVNAWPTRCVDWMRVNGWLGK